MALTCSIIAVQIHNARNFVATSGISTESGDRLAIRESVIAHHNVKAPDSESSFTRNSERLTDSYVFSCSPFTTHVCHLLQRWRLSRHLGKFK